MKFWLTKIPHILLLFLCSLLELGFGLRMVKTCIIGDTSLSKRFEHLLWLHEGFNIAMAGTLLFKLSLSHLLLDKDATYIHHTVRWALKSPLVLIYLIYLLPDQFLIDMRSNAQIIETLHNFLVLSIDSFCLLFHLDEVERTLRLDALRRCIMNSRRAHVGMK